MIPQLGMWRFLWIYNADVVQQFGKWLPLTDPCHFLLRPSAGRNRRCRERRLSVCGSTTGQGYRRVASLAMSNIHRFPPVSERSTAANCVEFLAVLAGSGTGCNLREDKQPVVVSPTIFCNWVTIANCPVLQDWYFLRLQIIHWKGERKYSSK